MDQLNTESGASRLDADLAVDEAGRHSITLHGELDIATAPGLCRKVETLIADGVTDLRVDLSELAFMDSSGVAVLLVAANGVECLELSGAQPIVRRVIEASGLTEVLRLGPA